MNVINRIVNYSLLGLLNQRDVLARELNYIVGGGASDGQKPAFGDVIRTYGITSRGRKYPTTENETSGK